VTRPAAVIAIAGLIITGGLTGASPSICALPGRYVGPNFSSGAAAGTPEMKFGPTYPPELKFGPTYPPELKFGPTYWQSHPSREDVDRAIDRLGSFDYDERMKAARAVRRAPGTVALPALLDAASGHADGFVRYRALVLLSGYDDPRVPDQMELALGEVNERLRAVAFAYFERHPEPRLIPAFLKAFDKENAEFVRPALARALAVLGSDTRVRAALLKDIARGQDFFLSAVIQALGDYNAVYALKAISQVAALGGPPKDAAVMALGKMGDAASMGLLTGLARTAPPDAQPTVAAAICLLGSNCESHRESLVRALTPTDGNPGFREVLRAAALGLSALAENGDVEAGRALFSAGVPAVDPARAPIALAMAGLAVRQPAAVVTLVQEREDRDQSIELLREGFDLLEDDFTEEQFFVALRKAYFAEADGSPRRALIQALINTLEF
jgi:HEAT repeat protein